MQHDCVIKLDIQAFLVSGSAIKLSTKFASGGKANVQKRANMRNDV